jgi:hypothetical protein
MEYAAVRSQMISGGEIINMNIWREVNNPLITARSAGKCLAVLKNQHPYDQTEIPDECCAN